MKLSLKRLFARSMTGGLDLVEAPQTSPPNRSAASKAAFITLAGALAILGAVVGA